MRLDPDTVALMVSEDFEDADALMDWLSECVLGGDALDVHLSPTLPARAKAWVNMWAATFKGSSWKVRVTQSEVELDGEFTYVGYFGVQRTRPVHSTRESLSYI